MFRSARYLVRSVCRFGRSQRSRWICSKTFGAQAVIGNPKRAVVRRNSASAMRNCGRPWSINTVTAEVLGIISCLLTDVQPVLDAIVESAARVCGIEDRYTATLRRVSLLFRGPILVRCRLPGPSQHRCATFSLGLGSMARSSHSRCPRRTMISHVWVRHSTHAPFSIIPCRQKGRSHRDISRTSHRSASLHPGADQIL